MGFNKNRAMFRNRSPPLAQLTLRAFGRRAVERLACTGGGSVSALAGSLAAAFGGDGGQPVPCAQRLENSKRRLERIARAQPTASRRASLRRGRDTSAFTRCWQPCAASRPNDEEKHARTSLVTATVTAIEALSPSFACGIVQTLHG